VKHLDLCSGIGGFALAARWMGWRTIGFAEIDPFASKVLAKNFPGVPNYGDIANIPAGTGADIITAGIPCQPYSCAGKRMGNEDDRAIWPVAREVIARVKPDWIVIENVAGFIGMALDGVLSDLEAEGYETGTVVLPACAVNAPHRRDRVWVVGHAASVGSGASRQEIDGARRTDRTCGAGQQQRLVPDSIGAGTRMEHIEIEDKNGNPPEHWNQRFYDKKTGRVVQKGLTQIARMFPTPRATEWKNPKGKTGNRTEEASNRAGWTLSEVVMFQTPTARDWKDGTAQSCANVPMNGLLGRAVHMLPTPTANRRDGLQSHGVNVVEGSLNPQFVEYLMNFPTDWTKLD
jgi:DNA-cytosine methyltransferase